MVKIDLSGVRSFTCAAGPAPDSSRVAHQKLGGYENTGWINLPEAYEKESERIKRAAEKISGNSDVLVVIGIGGSYLGARAAIEFIRSPFVNLLPKSEPDVYFAGNNASGEYLEQIIALIGKRDFSVNVVSKTGSTIETCAALRVFKALLDARYGQIGAGERLYVTTDSGSRLCQFAKKENVELFEIPAGCGGRFSVLSAVGLLPMRVAGLDTDLVIEGALKEKKEGLETALSYAEARRALYDCGKKIELLGCFEPSFKCFGEWWKQLFGESEGKEGQGIFPACAEYTTDLHSLGQYVQEGERTLFETLVSMEKSRSELSIPAGAFYDDGIGAIAGKRVDEVNKAAVDAVKKAHIEGGVPVIELFVPEASAETFGALAYFFETACAVSAIMSGVSPFNQPGVEAYKKRLFSNLGIDTGSG